MTSRPAGGRGSGCRLRCFPGTRPHRENGREQIVGAHALNLRRNLLAALKAQQGQSAVRVPAPARGEDRRCQHGLLEDRLTVSGCRKWKTSASGKLCCSASAILRPSSVAAACNSKLNERQKRLRSASPQALLMRPPKGAWITSCIPPPSSKKRSAMMVCCVGTAPSTARPCNKYSIDLLGAGVVEAALLFQPCTVCATSGLCCAGCRPAIFRQHVADLSAAARPLAPKVRRARRGFATPEGNARRRAVRILHQHAAGLAFHAANAPGGVAQQHDVARVALDGEIFVHACRPRCPRARRRRCNSAFSGMAPPLVIAASRRPRRARSGSPDRDEIRAVTSATGRDAFRQHFQNGRIPRAYRSR